MLQVRSIILRGPATKDAIVAFGDGANILAGASDTGKSYLVHCLDYIFGADELSKRIPEAEPYSQLFVEFANSAGDYLTLERSLAGGDLAAHYERLGSIKERTGEKVISSRSGRNQARDVTTILFEFAGIGEATLRKNDRGETQRLTIRTLLPLILVDEISVIDERSPIFGNSSFDTTARKRAFAYLLSGKDDSGIIAAEKKEIVNARRGAQLGLIEELLSPIEQRLEKNPVDDPDDTSDKIDETIAALTKTQSDHSEHRTSLEADRLEAIAKRHRAESQILAIDQLLAQYALLDDRYSSDLKRLDFIAEGSHFFNGLQEIRCPLCDQPMSLDHAHKAAVAAKDIYEASKAEASKILARRTDLAAATESLRSRRRLRETEQRDSSSTVNTADSRIANFLVPTMQEGAKRLEDLISRRIELEAIRIDQEQASSLRQAKEAIERASASGKGPARKWEPLPSKLLLMFCKEVEGVLKEWNWKGEGRVEFDESSYDIVVDGQSRQSHGKGFRAILHSAFVLGLLRYCGNNNRPHLGMVLIDSPLTSYKKGTVGDGHDAPIDPGMESGFWRSLTGFNTNLQLIILENKEPPKDVAASVHYEWFAGESALKGERVGFIPT
ncbi:hypothetical protein IVB27_40665 [Bradyrhizobium sp. 197]|jgi:hypothetical protein|uniref:hypothetical protein n=1 Tax=Bradyrhizobium sp. 197 TaxID=2782663 RepID=UPI001FFB66A1|nr:hypothetical protein [Bradyrhizobium sp. 197]MCK1480871.1 hypothetical protein [Bradyrhizobium sp. 197]